jgi:hypothetical protein
MNCASPRDEAAADDEDENEDEDDGMSETEPAEEPLRWE